MTEPPPEALEALSSGVERGHHLALVASEGAGLGRLYAAAVAHDLGGEPGGRALIIAATEERARRVARTIQSEIGDRGLETVAWSGHVGAGGDIVIGTPSRLLTDLRAGRLSLPTVRTLVLDDVRALDPDRAAVEALLQIAAQDTRLIAVTHRRDAAFDDLVQRRLHRARRWPPELAGVEGSGETSPRAAPHGPPLLLGSAPTREQRIGRAIELLHEMAEPGGVDRVVVRCVGEGEVEPVRTALAVEGFEVAGDEAGVRVAGMEANAAAGAPAVILLGLPRRAADLERVAGAARRRAAIVAPRHLRQLEILAERLGWPSRLLGDRVDAHRDEIAGFRALVEGAIEHGDLASSTLLIEPLIERHGTHAVAAALAGLLRETGRASERPSSAAATPAAGAPAPASSDAARATRPTWTRVFVNVGKQDGAAPGDFVGAITGETSAAAAQIGKIEIRPRFSLIDIDSMIVEDVIRGLNETRIKGRDVAARLDRDG